MSEAQKPDIIDFKLNHTMSLTAFQHLVDVLAKQDMYLVNQTVGENPCTGCKCINLIHLQYGINKRDTSYDYTICLNCWQIGFWLPIYENESSSND